MFGHDDQQQTTTDEAATATVAAPADNSEPAAEPTPAVPDPSTSPYLTDDAPVESTATLPAPTPAAGTDDLLTIKQKALQQLSPLVDHLDQTPEEKFRTTMMMIQASDDQQLIKPAYEAAQQISDEKTRAQALLDIVNEINYFTQHPDGN